MKNLAKPLFEIRSFAGINNHDPAEKVLPRGGKSFLTAGLNIDLDNTGMAHRRKGYLAPSYSGAVQSLWSNGYSCLFVENGDLKILNPDFTASVIRAGVGQTRMVYADAAGRAYYTNEIVIGYVENRIGFIFPAPTMTYRIPMPAGHLIEWFNGRLYVAKGREIWASDPVYPGQTHEREGFKQFGGRLTMMRGIKETGIVVCDGINVYLMQGLDFNEFTVNKLADFPAILGSDVKIDGAKLGKGLPGEVVLWLSPKGVCAAGKGGFFQAVTFDYYHPATTSEGSAIVREAGGHFQYLVSQHEAPAPVLIDSPAFRGTGVLAAEMA